MDSNRGEHKGEILAEDSVAGPGSQPTQIREE